MMLRRNVFSSVSLTGEDQDGRWGERETTRGPMRWARTAAMVLITVLAGVELSGCGGGSSGTAALPAAVSSTRAGAMDESGGKTNSPGEPTPTQSVSATEALPQLSDRGLGELKLGLSRKQARALGAVGKTIQGDESEVCTSYRGKNGVRTLYFNHDRLVVIDIGPKIKLDTGIGIGSTYQDLNHAQGRPKDDFDGYGRVYYSAPDAPFAAEYRIGLDTDNAYRDSKITEIALQATELGCYE
jgi:hypothetical protein